LSIEKRLLKLADSFADEVSRDDKERFKARVLESLEISESCGTPRTVEGVSRETGPTGGTLREGEATEQTGVNDDARADHRRPAGPARMSRKDCKAQHCS
jgi:hypothetical protein